MAYPPAFKRMLKVVFGATALAFALAVGVPHVHADASHSHPAQTCRACKIQDGFSAAPASPAIAALPQAPVGTLYSLSYQSPHFRSVVRLAPSRAPPVLA